MIQVGSPVRLVSELHAMTVSKIFPSGLIECTWFDSMLHQVYGQFTSACLVELSVEYRFEDGAEILDFSDKTNPQ